MNIRPIVVEKEMAAQIVAISISTLESLERSGLFPKRRLLAGRRVGYLVGEIEVWAESRPSSDQPPPPNTGAPKPRARKDARPVV